MSYLMSGMYALPLCVPINRAYNGVECGLVACIVCMLHLFICQFSYSIYNEL